MERNPKLAVMEAFMTAVMKSLMRLIWTLPIWNLRKMLRESWMMKMTTKKKISLKER